MMNNSSSNSVQVHECQILPLQEEWPPYEQPPFQHRMNNHCFNIAHGCIDKSPVVAHFTSEGHTEAELLVMIIDKCWKKDAILRKIRESRWIRMLETSWLSGTNQRTDDL